MVIKEGTSLDIVGLYKDIIRQEYGEFLTETKTAIGTGKAKDGRYYLILRTTQDVNLARIERRIPNDVPYAVEYVSEYKLQDYQKPGIKKSIAVDPSIHTLTKIIDKELKEMREGC
jgi:hypothetical protein